NTSDIPNNWVDRMRGRLVVIFFLWIVAQRDGLACRNSIETLRNQWKILRAERWLGRVASQVKKGQPGYWSAKIGEGTIYAFMSIALADALFPWLTGRPNHMGVFG